MAYEWVSQAKLEESSLTYHKAQNNPLIPAGLEFLYTACRQLYPDQPNPLQVTAVVKFWLGGPDPLDYISMYYNPGDSAQKIPPHWHYVSFGLSDLHGDGRVHEVAEPHLPSGFGFELTMRVRCEEDEKTPPTWPAALMQSLAKYLFQTDSIFCAGDHVSWHNALDNSESRIQHMLICPDPQLSVQYTPFGRVQFLQVVGLTVEELQAAQKWNGSGVLNIMKRFPECGGWWHITDMKRGETIFDMDASVAEEVENGIEKEGSDLSGVSAKVTWTLWEDECFEPVEIKDDQHRCNEDPINKKEQQRFTVNQKDSNAGIESVSEKKDDNFVEKHDAFFFQVLPSLHLTINLESGSLLPLALRGRLKHGRHFTFKSPMGINALTFLTPSVEGGFVSPANPYAVKGPWLQVLVDEELLQEMSSDLAPLTNPKNVSVPASYEWKSKKLKITVVGDDVIF